MFQGFILTNGIRHDGGPGSGPQGGQHTMEHNASSYMQRAGKGENINKLMKEIGEKHGLGKAHHEAIRNTMERMQEITNRLSIRKFGPGYAS
jgi:EAL domain-containing protein (putative c-di-GMP-specific phosphodiesterase class I)